jgi:hypothetical protein
MLGEQETKKPSASNKVEVSQESGKDPLERGWREEDDFAAACQ